VGRASIVGAAETSVGKVRDHNEDAHFIDPDLGIFAVCDGMGGHAAGEVASGIAVKVVRESWSSESTHQIVDSWLELGTIDARKRLLATVSSGVYAAHDSIMAEAGRDRAKTGMGTTIIGALVIGADIVFAQCGDSRAYMVRDGIAMQLTEDHTLLARLLAAGVEVDTSSEGSRFKSMLTNALGIGTECKVATFVVPLADGDRFLLCSDGITEYVQEAEIGEVLTQQPSPARAAQRLVELALQRGGADNATALVIRVLEAGETARPTEQLQRENTAINRCPLWAKVTPQGRLRALRIALPRDYASGDKVPAQTLGDRVAWIIVDGEVDQDGVLRGPGSLLYPEALLKDSPLPDKDGLAVAQSDVRALALRCDDFYEVCEDDNELGELLLAALGAEIATRRRPMSIGAPRLVVGENAPGLESATTDPNMRAVVPGRKTGASHPPAMAMLGSAITPPQGTKTPVKTTAPMGVVGLASAATAPPVSGREETMPPPVSDPGNARGPSPLTMPRTATKDGPGGAPRVAGPSSLARQVDRLILPKDDSSTAGSLDHALGHALDALGDRTPRAPRAPRAPQPPQPPPPAPITQSPRNEDDDPEVVIEADEPPERDEDVPRGVGEAHGIGDHSEPEISIEQLVELDVEEPMNVSSRDEYSAPEITIIPHDRPITADDSAQVSGSIENKPPRSAKPTD
jgi:serine/threonine protein phosphatase PrpC